jgi:hydrogenase-4 component F
MILLALILVPALAAAIAYLLPSAARGALLVGTALLHVGLVAALWVVPAHGGLAGWLLDDDLGRLILSLVSILFLAFAHYAVGYLREENPRGGRAFVSCMLAFLAAATLVAVSQHMALLWIGMETTTLSVAPLIYHRHDRRSLEAVWKYLVLSSVGIAFALLGVFLLATSQPTVGAGRPLVVSDMITHARALDPRWLRAAFVFMLIGFGTKMGLAPMHSWKPDTYGEAPSLVGGVMAGALTACAFLGLARVSSICFAAGAGDFIRPPLIAFGLLSLAVAAAFIVGQADIRRLLGYSSVEHMGLLALALGLGGSGAYGAVLHTVNNGIAKSMVFLAVGNVLLAAGTSSSARVKGLLRRTPVSGALLVIGLFAITGSPPFGMFISEFTIVMAAVATHPWIAALVVVLLSVIFVGIAVMVLELVYGGEQPDAHTPSSEQPWLVVAPVALAVLVLGLGVYIPGPMARALAGAALALGGHAP